MHWGKIEYDHFRTGIRGRSMLVADNFSLIHHKTGNIEWDLAKQTFFRSGLPTLKISFEIILIFYLINLTCTNSLADAINKLMIPKFLKGCFCFHRLLKTKCILTFHQEKCQYFINFISRKRCLFYDVSFLLVMMSYFVIIDVKK